MAIIPNKKTLADARAANKLQYAPKPPLRPARPARINQESAEYVALKKITARTLEALKNPAKPPSEIIMAALLEARKHV